MSNELEKNQAEKLQQLFEEINNRPLQEKENTEKKVEEDFIEVDVLNLPPRKEVHTKPKTRLYFHFKRPYIRFLIVFILIIVFIVTLFLTIGERLVFFL